MQNLASGRRCGVLTKKIGMTRIFESDGRHCPVSVLQLVATRVLAVREDKQVDKRAIPPSQGNSQAKSTEDTPAEANKTEGSQTETNKTEAKQVETNQAEAKFNVLLAGGLQKKQRLTKPMRGLFEKANCPPMRKIVSFKVSQDCLPEEGTVLSVAHFLEGQFVDASATSIGKGFAGAMKRHGFKGLRATHGVSVSHRSMGSTGNREFPGKVFKGKKMPGRMGGKRITVQNLKVVALDEERNLILLKGAVPGARGGWVIVNDAIKKILPPEAPRPTFVANTKSTSAEASATDASANDTSANDTSANDTSANASATDASATDASAKDVNEGEKS